MEGWDRPDVEITTSKSTTVAYASRDRDKASHELDNVRISVVRQGDEIVVKTDFPRRRGLPRNSILRPPTGFDLDYNIKAPMNARLVVDHGTGEVTVLTRKAISAA